MAGKSSKWMKMVRKEQMDEVLEEAETGAQQSEESARPRTGPGREGLQPQRCGWNGHYTRESSMGNGERTQTAEKQHRENAELE